jgi:ribonucleoside-diphosphate reductase alpha chain
MTEWVLQPFRHITSRFSNFHYLRPIWAQTTQKDALLGIGMTGIGSEKFEFNLKLQQIQQRWLIVLFQKKIGINEAARVTCIKPAGTTSLALGVASGIHAWHAPFYLRTMRFNKMKLLHNI